MPVGDNRLSCNDSDSFLSQLSLVSSVTYLNLLIKIRVKFVPVAMACKIFIDLPNGRKMPALGLGTWQSKDEEVELAVNEALEAGYRHIDTAFLYENEHVIGRVLKKWISEGKVTRDELFITTKLPGIGMHAERVEQFLKKSLENLQLDYVDLYLVHSPIGFNYREDSIRPVTEKGEADLDLTTDHIAIWKQMEAQFDAGRAKSIGLSNFNVQQIQKILNVARIKPANLQIELHVYMQQRELVDFCKENDITVVAYSPLGSPGINAFLARFGKSKDIPDILGNPVVKKIANKHSKKPAHVLLRHILQRGIAVIPKSVTPERVRSNIDVFDFVLDDDDMKELDALEVGPSARVCDFRALPKTETHPEFPFNKL